MYFGTDTPEVVLHAIRSESTLVFPAPVAILTT
jgi:hypothetical protein